MSVYGQYGRWLSLRDEKISKLRKYLKNDVTTYGIIQIRFPGNGPMNYIIHPSDRDFGPLFYSNLLTTTALAR